MVNVVLTEIRPGDSEQMFAWINDPETVHYNAPYKPISWAAHSLWFENLGKNPQQIILAIRTASVEKIMGVIQLIDIHPVHRTAELTMRIGEEKNRGHGYGTLAIKQAVEFAFKNLNLQRIWLRAFSSNERAIAAYEKAGFQKEGVLRRSAYINGLWEDEVIMGILREE